MFEKYIKIDDIIATLLYFIAFLRMPTIDMYNKIKIYILFVVLIYCIYNFSQIDSKYKRINLFLVFFGIWTLISAFRMTNPFSAALYFVFSLLGITLALEILVKRIGYNNLIKSFFRSSGLVIFLLDCYIFSGRVNWQGDGTNFGIGTKFAVMYQHLIFLWLWLSVTQENQKLKKVRFLLVPFIIAIGIKVDCNTGIVGTALFLIIICLVLKI